MSAPPFTIVFTEEALRIFADPAKPACVTKLKKARKALRLLRDIGPSHPGLNSHKYQSLSGPNGEDVWESYVESKTPGAWRIWWQYGPDPDTVTIITLGPHP